MASIEPTELPEIKEEVPVDVTFTAVLDPVIYEQLVSIDITAYTPNDGITVDGPRYYGQYIDSFDLGANALLYRDNTDLSYGSAGSFEDLPDPSITHLYRFNAPSSLTEPYPYTVTLIYVINDPMFPIDPDDPANWITIEETFIQNVKGEWTKWANQLTSYIAAQGA